MEQAKLLDTHIQLRRTYNLLGEVYDLSLQLAEALDRNDSVSAQMILAMRGEPIRQLENTREAIKLQLEAASAADRERLRALLNGAPASEAGEQAFAEQVAANGRLLKQVQELDRGLSRKIAREESVYGQ